MRDLAVRFLHMLATFARLAGSGGAGSDVTESVLVKQQYNSRRFRARATLASLVVAFGFLSASDILIPQAQETALDRYVNSRDTVYGWKLIHTAHGEGYQAFVLEFTSQTWRTAAEVDRPVWKHWLTIVKPLRTTSRTAMLFIGGGSNDNPAPTTADLRTISYALESNTVVADLGMVPNQPLVFVDSKDKRRSEDDLIAYTRVRHFSTKDDTWLVRLAMVKSGVRAMDAIQEFLASEAGGRLTVDRFVVSGGSKRGWTTWLVGAVDDRVVAIMPTVIDALNSELITRHHFEAMGFFSSALNDYVNHGLFPHKIGTPEYRAVLGIEDPYVYRHRARLRIPKYLVHASGDQFFLPITRGSTSRTSRVRSTSATFRTRGTTWPAAMHATVFSPSTSRSSRTGRGRSSRGRGRPTDRYASMSRIGRLRSISGRPPMRRRAISGSTSSALRTRRRR